MRIIGLLLAVALAFGATTEASAEDDAEQRLALAHRFIAAIQTDQMGAMLGQVTAALVPRRADATPAQQAALETAMTRAAQDMLPKMFDVAAPIYADIFTLEELTALVDFYESPVGRSMIEKSYAATPRLTAAMVQMTPDLMRGVADSLCREMNCTPEERAEFDQKLAQAGYGSAAAAAGD